MTRTDPHRPTSTIGLAVADRALQLAGSLDNSSNRSGVVVDLTAPEISQLPIHVLEAAKDALDRGETHYTSRPGVPELRSAIARRLAETGIPATADDVVVTNGGAEALYIAFQSVIAAGDRVLVVEPIDPNVANMLEFIGAGVARVTPSGTAGLIPTKEDIAAAGARILMLASPSPISGVAIAMPVLEGLLRAALDRGMVPILDLSASTCYYEPVCERFQDQGVAPRIITTGSFSPGYGLAGWGVGYVSAPEARMGTLRNLKQAMSICTTAVSQFAALAALEGPDDWLAERRNAFAAKRDFAINELRSAGLPVVEPSVYPSLLIDVRSLDTDDRRVASRLEREACTIVCPGSAFGTATRGFIRIDLGVDSATLMAGVKRIAGLARNGALEI